MYLREIVHLFRADVKPVTASTTQDMYYKMHGVQVIPNARRRASCRKGKGSPETISTHFEFVS